VKGAANRFAVKAAAFPEDALVRIEPADINTESDPLRRLAIRYNRNDERRRSAGEIS
jgi:hypothetical protein